MKIVFDSTKEISMVTAKASEGKCSVNWKMSDGGVIICLFTALEDYQLKDIISAINDAQWQELFDKEYFSFTSKNGETIHLRYLSEKMAHAFTNGYNFPVPSNFSLPIRVQLWCVNNEKTELYYHENDSCGCIIKADANITIRSLGFFRSLFCKGKKVRIQIKNPNKYPDGVICYTVPNSLVDKNGEPYEYPVPKHCLGNEFILPVKEFSLTQGDGFKDLINLKVTYDD